MKTLPVFRTFDPATSNVASTDSLAADKSSGYAEHPQYPNHPENPAISHIIPDIPAISHPQPIDNEELPRKSRPASPLEKISSAQRSQLFEWLADHTYEEVSELVAAESPAGFGFTVGKSTLGRFYKAHFYEIDRLRQRRIEGRAAEMLHRPDGHDYRATLRDSYTQLLLERLWELLSRPVQSADELKKLTAVAEKMKSLDRDKELLQELQEEQRRAELASLFAGQLSKSAAGAPAP